MSELQSVHGIPLRLQIERLRSEISNVRYRLLDECLPRRLFDPIPNAVRTAIYNAASASENLMNLLARAETIIEEAEAAPEASCQMESRLPEPIEAELGRS